MITLRADLHTHTIASGHAYSTIKEMAEMAGEKGLELIAMTDHAPAMPGSCQTLHFSNLRALPRQIDGVTVLRGVELNVLNTQGKLDLPRGLQERLEWRIASLHENVLIPEEGCDYTGLYLALAENPQIDMIGHPDSPDFPFDVETVVPAWAAQGKVVELNEHHAFDISPRNLENARRLMAACARCGALVAVDSDAHTCWSVGEFSRAAALLNEMGFPEKQVLNTSAQRVLDFIHSKKVL
ncbi:MAG: phosphatase [Fretibacterium sp.]|jgi:putative hydrolase|nr:phosphatase [Fretibacterium sp.]